MAQVLTARPSGFWSMDLIVEEDGREVLSVDVGFWRNRIAFRINDRTYECVRTGFPRSVYSMISVDGVLARARQSLSLVERVRIEIGDRAYSLRRVSLFRMMLAIVEGEERVGRIERAGFLTRRSRIVAPDDWGLEVCVFALWIARDVWRRATRRPLD